MNKKPLVSVLLSIYNVEKYLEECLDSILAQSYENLEIVCVDNGSPDNCGKILKKYAKKDKRIKVVTLPENRMLCGGRNAGLDNATGDFLCFVDPDDWIEKNHIKAMVDAILKEKDPEGNKCNLVINTNAYSYLEKTHSILHNFNKQEKWISIKDYNKDIRLDTDIPMWGRLYRKTFLDKYNIKFLNEKMFDNIPYTTKIFAHMKYFYQISIKNYPNSGYWRRMQKPEGELTETVLFKNFEVTDCLENLYDYLKENGLEHSVKVMYHLFFTVCFPAHKDKFKLYKKFKELMIKMEDDIKSAPDVYQQYEIDLCDLLIYTSDFFQFTSLYFSKPTPNNSSQIYITQYKLFDIIPFFRKVIKYQKTTTYYIFGLPFLKINKKVNNKAKKFLLLKIIPILKISYKFK